MLSVLLNPVSLSLLLVCAVLLAVLGWRGRRMDDHPVCRRCRFDLYGLREPSNCPECGAALASPRASLLGNRRKRPIMLAGAAGLAVVFSGLLFLRVGDVDWQAHKPEWWLLMEARSTNTMLRDEALAEIDQRLSAQTFSEAGFRRLVPHLLDIHADPDAAWTTQMADLIELKYPDGAWDPDLLQRYVDQLAQMPVELIVRDRVAHGDTIPYHVMLGPNRVPFNSDLRLFTRIVEVEVAGHARPTGGRMSTTLNQGSSMTGSQGSLSAAEWDAIHPGVHDVQVRLTLGLSLGAANATDADFLAHREIVLREKIEILPPGVKTVTVDTASTIQPEDWEDAIIIESVSIDMIGRLNVPVRMTKFAPAAFAFRVEVLSGDRVWPMEFGLALDPATMTSDIHFTHLQSQHDDLDALTGDRVDIRLVPDPSVAGRTVNVFNIWGGELIIRDVPVQRQP